MDKETKKCGCTGERCVTLEAFRANDKVENLIEKMGEEASNINSILKAIKSLTSANSKKSTIISTEDMDVIIITKDNDRTIGDMHLSLA